VSNANRRRDITRMLNSAVTGFMQESLDVVRVSLVKRFMIQFKLKVKPEDIVLIIDQLYEPPRCVMSVHLDIDGEHYESIIRNVDHDYGYDP
jgi:hypothetical protein